MAGGLDFLKNWITHIKRKGTVVDSEILPSNILWKYFSDFHFQEDNEETYVKEFI